jgi:hypothetical protein
MVAAIRQTVTVGPGGRVEVQAPELTEGARAEVIVLLEHPSVPAAQLAAFERLQAGLKLDEAGARQWAAHARAERESFGPRE